MKWRCWELNDSWHGLMKRWFFTSLTIHFHVVNNIKMRGRSEHRSKGVLPTRMANSLNEALHSGAAREVKFIVLLLNEAKPKCFVCLHLMCLLNTGLRGKITSCCFSSLEAVTVHWPVFSLKLFIWVTTAEKKKRALGTSGSLEQKIEEQQLASNPCFFILQQHCS